MQKNLNIIIRKIQFEDAEILMELNNNLEISHYVVGSPKKVSLSEQLEWMSNITKEKNTERWMVEYNKKIVGTVIISSIDIINKTGNINIKLLPSFQGCGIAFEALKKICDIGFDELKLYCLTANILPYNLKSIGLFKKIGFKQDGILRSRVVKNGERYDLITLSLLKVERMDK